MEVAANQTLIKSQFEIRKLLEVLESYRGEDTPNASDPVGLAMLSLLCAHRELNNALPRHLADDWTGRNALARLQERRKK